MENYRKCFKCGCSPAKDNVMLFRFPKPGITNLIRCTLWAKYVFPEKEYASIVFQQKIHNEHRMLCQRHFKDEDFVDSTKSKLLRTAIPCDVQHVVRVYVGGHSQRMHFCDISNLRNVKAAPASNQDAEDNKPAARPSTATDYAHQAKENIQPVAGPSTAAPIAASQSQDMLLQKCHK